MIKSNWPKRYYVTYKIYVRIKYFLIIMFLYRNKMQGLKILNKAIYDANHDIEGLDPVYKPGWKAKKV